MTDSYARAAADPELCRAMMTQITVGHYSHSPADAAAHLGLLHAAQNQRIIELLGTIAKKK